MDILTYKEEEHEIEVSPIAENDPNFVLLRSQDKTRDKRIYKEKLLYLFFMYKREGEYSERILSDRKRIVESRYLKELKAEEIEKDEAFIGVRQFYLEEQFTLTENTYFAVEEDIDNLIRHINSIPYNKREKIKVNITVPKYDIEDLPEDKLETKTVEKEVNVNNSEEKLKAMESLQKILKWKQDLKEMIKKERTESKRSNNFYMFDKQ